MSVPGPGPRRFAPAEHGGAGQACPSGGWRPLQAGDAAFVCVTDKFPAGYVPRVGDPYLFRDVATAEHVAAAWNSYYAPQPGPWRVARFVLERQKWYWDNEAGEYRPCVQRELEMRE